jgi:hypothetical protein
MDTTYFETASEMIAKSNFQIHSGSFVYAKVNSVENTDEHFLVSRDADEITVVTKEENLAKLALVERNKDDYRLIALNVLVPFYSVGFIATVTDAFAKNGMNILVVSTYSKDYLLVRADLIKTAEEILLALGFRSAM